MSEKSVFTKEEKRGTISLAAIFALRLGGIFLLLPVFALYTVHLEGATPFLIGMALGGYGLSQALCQVPFGILSDRFGRKIIIIIGLLIFASGSALCAMADSITTMLIGRFLQGSGAIASVIIAYIADITTDANRLKAMSIVGSSIGMTFCLSLIISPFIANNYGVPTIFWITVVLIFCAILYLAFFMEEPKKHADHDEVEINFHSIKTVLKDRKLLLLDYGIFFIHLSLTAVFVTLPFYLEEFYDLSELWKVYLPVILVSMLALPPMMILANRKKMEDTLFRICTVFLMLSFIAFLEADHSLAICVGGLLLFFIGFNSLSALLPSSVSKQSRREVRGTSLGIYNTSEFFGTFLGGVVGGLFHGINPHFTFYFLLLLAASWLLFLSRSPGHAPANQPLMQDAPPKK